MFSVLPPVEAASAVTQPPATARPDSERRHVLLVEDDELVRETVIGLLEDHCNVSVELSASSAVASLDRSAYAGPQVILLDCQLPGGGVADVLRAADARGIPVVLISGDPARAAKLDAQRPFVPKPFSQATLLLALGVRR